MLSPLLREVDQARYQADLLRVTGARPPGSAHWREVQALCAQRLESLGYAVERHRYATGENVIGVRAGARAPKEQVILSAHYDGVPDCAAADDNASGVAGVLEAARVLALRPHDRTLVIACWDEEERGLIGSEAYAARARARGDDLKAVYVYEMIGYRSAAPGSQTIPAGFGLLFPKQVERIGDNGNRGDFIAVVSDGASQAAAAHLERVGEAQGLPVVTLPVPENLKNSPILQDLRRSDHASFWAASFPAMMITDTANFRNTHYHCSGGPDNAERLDGAFAALVIRATVGSALELLKAP